MAEICCICDGEKLINEKELVKISLTSFDRIKAFSKSWSEIGKYNNLQEKLSVVSFPNEWKFHRNCYIGLTHKNNLQNAKKAFDAEASTADKNHSIDLCIFCAKDGVKTSKVSSVKVANDIIQLKNKTLNSDLRSALNIFKDPLDVISNGMRYHSKCLIKEQKTIINEAAERDQDVCSKYVKVNDDFLLAVKKMLTSSGEDAPTTDALNS